MAEKEILENQKVIMQMLIAIAQESTKSALVKLLQERIMITETIIKCAV